MPDQPPAALEEDISVHIFTTSAAMVGVCLTVIGIIRLVIAGRNTGTIADDLLAADALLFMTSCLLSYAALRTRHKARMYRVENVADTIFVLALMLMVAVCGVIAYSLV